MRLASISIAFALSLLLATGAAAEPRPGGLDDPAGDAAAGGADLRSAAVDYDTDGRVTVRFTFAAAPASNSPSVVGAIVGSRTSTGSCATAFAFGAGLGSAAPASRWSTRDGAAGDGSRSLEGATLTVAAQDPRLGGDLDCFTVVLQRGSGTSTVEEDRAGPADLRLPDGDGDGVADRDDRCATQAAPGQADGCPPAPATTPAPTTPPPAEPVPPAPTATAVERYDAAVARCPRRQGRSRSACLRRARSSHAKGYAQARKRARNPFMGKAFFRPDVDVGGFCGGTCLTGLVFVDDRFAFRGEPEDGPVLVRCTQVTVKEADDDGCLRYTLSKDRRTATVGAKRYRIARDSRSIEPAGDEAQLTRVRIPLPGLRFAAQLNSISSFGTPGVNQSFSTSELTFARDGRFVAAGGVSGTNGQGSDFESSFTAIAPERRGTYAFEPGGTLALRFGDGRISRRSAFVAFGAKQALGDPARDGLFLNGSFYNPPD